ncbi:Oxidored-FMN domain-containing protein [Fusarium keratoplasticum]|uniref:Oxidored-FMN domain-containing protein n=1 Tax=Fusarium keratoplasticum TaxID=1328300 RepID=A0ACC0QRB8_9HYPO|nr:Oxidored-FMN domain-containing protein [Fusarium keratoplasticum]KAI8663349.1 Oxidored-FMN domain-containing protein [Fusarium keratoplasticum]KAI8664037.1 Oxidored-FMN domain-containing protein [Fusarium keratoplasticum]
MTKLFTPVKVGAMSLSQRIAMAPMTRLRASDSHVPLPSVKEYFKQRASAPGSLVVTEATVISPRHGGYANVPGIYNQSQIDAWREVTNAVHAKGSYIFLQLWALGRAANPQLLEKGGHQLVSSSDVPMKSAFSDDMHYPTPLTEDGIWDAISDFAAAAKNAISAGFDGVEIHGANGYLVDQFIQDVSNKRTDTWGGSIENRSRFAVEVTRAVVEAVGSERTAIRLSPWSKYQGVRMDDPIPQFSDVVRRLADFKLAYLHVCESDDRQTNGEEIKFILDTYGDASPVLVAGNYDAASAKKAVDVDYVDHDVVVAFGRPYISNPDLVFKAKNGIEFAPLDPKNMYAQSDEGYIDYPFAQEAKDE